MALIDWSFSYYKMDTSGSFPDAVWSNDWTINGATFEDWGWIINSCYSFVTNDYITTPWDISFIQNTWVFTVSIWFKLADYTYNGYSIFDWNNVATAGQKGYVFFYDNRSWIRTNELLFMVWNGTSYTSKMTTTITDNNWHMVTATGNGTTAYLYIDSVQVDTQAIWTLATWSSTSALRYLWSTTSWTAYLNWKLDEPRIADEYKTLAQVQELYASGAGNQYPFSATDTSKMFLMF